MDCLALRKQVLDLSWAKFLIATNINVTLTPINVIDHEGCAHEGFDDGGPAGIARLRGHSNG